VRLLLDELDTPQAYVPVDVSHEQLTAVAAERAAQYPGLRVMPVCADYTRPLELPQLPPSARRIAFFPGSTIGNFHPTEAAAFLHRVRHTVGSRGGMILGVDRRKDPQVLHDAYNDAAGVTAAFNRNLLVRLNRELNATFDLDTFRHVAFFNDEASRIEMHLESTVAQEVRVADAVIAFEAGDDSHRMLLQVRRGATHGAGGGERLSYRRVVYRCQRLVLGGVVAADLSDILAFPLQPTDP
jgi:dimethylhistidine N-methyltransferase